ncbi:MAG: hypothetical protein DMF53_21600 [Acidobacteria bacterium]|nr:MAG: hypothetical protein DMF53_21600 [Acidobacteriota bacterium]
MFRRPGGRLDADLPPAQHPAAGPRLARLEAALAVVGGGRGDGLEARSGRGPLHRVEAGLVPARVEASSIPAIPSHAVRAKSGSQPSLPAVPARSLSSIATLILGAWALGALVLLAAFGRSYLRLGRRLHGRPRVVGGDLHAQLRTLAAQAGLADAVRLSCSCRVPVPLAMGLREPEICVPPRALVGLTEEQQEGMLAHELAHLARRDPFWLVLGQGLACVLFFQPLNWVARRRLREISEMLSDEWAVARTGRPLSLAGCLAEVAGWSVGSRALPVPSMADRPSSLGRRIRRLLDETRLPESPARRAWLAAAMGVLIIAIAAAAPAVSAARPDEPLQPKKPAAPHVEVDVNDATDVPTAHAAAEEDRDHGRHDHAQAMKDREAEDEDAEPVVDADEIGDQVSASVEEAMAGLDGQLQALSEQHELTKEQQEKLSRDMEKMSRDLQKNLNPRLEELTRELSEKATKMAPSAEMQRLAQEMAKLGEQMRPSEEEMAKLQALVDQEVRKHGSDGKLTVEERERIRHQAREMAEKMKPTDEQRHKMEELRAQMEAERAKMGEDFRAANREEMEKLQREIHEEVEREMRAVRDEIRRSMDERKAIDRQEHKDRKEHRHKDKPDHDKDHDHDGDGRKQAGC